jgi:predicted RNA binding protein YcfA (HicA-like mRNA interferase family)
VRRFPSLNAKVFYRILTSEPLNYKLKRKGSGSHRILCAKGRQMINFSWHDNEEISGHVIKRILVCNAMLTVEQAWEVIH